MILKVGLTGGIASGKSSVARTLAGLGCFVIDADAVVRRLYRPHAAGWLALVQEYGERILDRGEIDRPRLSAIALATPADAAKLNSLIHPLVLEEESRMIEAESSRFPERDRIIVVEATLLLESGGRERYDRIVVVDATADKQLELGVSRGMTKKEISRRMAVQMSREERLAAADYVVSNSGDRRDLERETMALYEKLRGDLRVGRRNP